MLFLSLFLFATEALASKDMGKLVFNPASTFSASPARGNQYTAFLQEKPPALSLVATRVDSEKQAKELLEKVGNKDNFKELRAFSSADANIDVGKYGRFTIRESNITNGEFDGYYRVQGAASKNYKLFVQNVRSLDVLKSFMAELLKAYIGRDALFKEVTPSIPGNARTPAVQDGGQQLLSASKDKKSGAILESDVAKTAATGQQNEGQQSLKNGRKDNDDHAADLQVKPAYQDSNQGALLNFSLNRSSSEQEEGDAWYQQFWKIMLYQKGVPAAVFTAGVCYGVWWVFFCPEFKKVNDVPSNNLSCSWDANVSELAKQVEEVCFANASFANVLEMRPARILPLPQELKSISAPFFQPQPAPILLPGQVIKNVTQFMSWAVCLANSTRLLDPVTSALGTCPWDPKYEGDLKIKKPGIQSAANLPQSNSSQVPPKLSFLKTCGVLFYTWFCWFASLLGYA